MRLPHLTCERLLFLSAATLFGLSLFFARWPSASCVALMAALLTLLLAIGIVEDHRGGSR